MLEIGKVYKLSEKVLKYPGNTPIPVYGMNDNNLVILIDIIFYAANLVWMIPRLTAKFLIQGSPYEVKSGYICEVYNRSTHKLVCISGVTTKDLEDNYIVKEDQCSLT